MKIIVIFSFLAASLSTCSSHSQQDIVLVNVEHLDRGRIADEISIINDLNPRVIAIDLQFDESRNDGNDDKLIKALWGSKNLVMASLVHKLGGNTFIGLASQAEFSPEQSKSGFINSLPEDDKLGTLRRFIVHERESFGNQRTGFHFAICTAMVYDSSKAMKFVKTHPKIVEIDYKGGKRQFKKYSAKEVLEGKLTKKDVGGKIVMIGFLGPGNEDKFYTPLNKSRDEPDMYGLEYLANIVAQVLEYGGE